MQNREKLICNFKDELLNFEIVLQTRTYFIGIRYGKKKIMIK